MGNTNDELIVGVTTALIEDAAKSTWSKICGFFDKLGAKEQIKLRTAYRDYLFKTSQKNRKIKTLIYRHSPRDLYSFYECIGVMYEKNNICTNSVNNLIHVGHKIIITGTGGIGKSTLLKHLFLNSIHETNLIPVLIELRSFNNIDLKENFLNNIIYENLTNNGFKLEMPYYEYSMEGGAYIILFDGFDEIKRDRAQLISNEIRAISSKYPDNFYILSSRPNEEFIGWNDFIELKALKLTKEQALSLINKIEFDANVKMVFSKELENGLYEKYESFASNPLLLTIMLLTFDNRASIPDKLNDFYEQAFATLFNMHDATKEAYIRDIRSGLSCEDFKTVFAYICFKSYFSSQYEFTELSLREYIQKASEKFSNIKFGTDEFKEDLIKSVCMMVKDGLKYRFSHRSFQEYFSAWYTCKLTDDIQYKLLTGWIREAKNVNSDSYFTMLYNIQSEKFNKIILCPGLKTVKQLLEEHNYSVKFLKNLFSDISFRKVLDINSKSSIHITLTIQDKYLCECIRMACSLNGYIYHNNGIDIESELARKVFDKQKLRIEYNFDNLLKLCSEEEILFATNWFKEQLEFSLEILKMYEGNYLGNKRKVSTILDEL